MHRIFNKKVAILVIFTVIAVFLYLYLSVFMPIILAFFTALLLEPLVQLIQKMLRFKRRIASVTITFVLFLCFISASIFLAVTKLINQAVRFIERLPYYIVEFTFFIDDLIEKINIAVEGLPPIVIEELNNQSQTILEKGDIFARTAISTLTDWAQGLPNLIILLIVYLITLFLISMDLPQLRERFYSMFKEESAAKVRYMSQRVGYVFVGFFKAQFLVSIVIFIVAYLGLLLISPSNALLMATIIWIIDFIPLIGSIVILAPWSLFHFASGDISTGAQLLILAAILLILRRTLEPLIMGDQIGLSALATLISLYLGLSFFGIVGVVIGPILFIAIKSAMEAGIIRTDYKI